MHNIKDIRKNFNNFDESLKKRFVKLDIKKIESDWKTKFKVFFIYNSGSTFDFKKWKIWISSSRFNS